MECSVLSYVHKLSTSLLDYFQSKAINDSIKNCGL